MKDIDYKIIIDNYNKMINILEFDSMRSAGKAKLNAPTIESMYILTDRYAKLLKEMKPTPAKTEG